MIKDLAQEISLLRARLCQADDEIEDAEDRRVALTEVFVQVPAKGSSYD